MIKFYLGIAIFVLFGVGCSEKYNLSKEQTSRQIDQLYQQFAVAYDSLDPNIVSNLYSDSAYYLVPNPKREIISGRSSIRKAFVGFIEGAAKNKRSISIDFRIIERKITDSLAFDVGYYQTKSKPDSVDSFPERGSVGKFVTVIGLTPEGDWRFLLDSYSPAPSKSFSQLENRAHSPLTSK